MHMIQLRNKLSLCCITALTGICFLSFCILCGAGDNNALIPVMTQCVHLGIRVIVAAYAGMAGVAQLSTSRFSDSYRPVIFNIFAGIMDVARCRTKVS